MKLFDADEFNILETYALLTLMLMSRGYVCLNAKIVNDYGLVTKREYDRTINNYCRINQSKLL